VDADNLPSDIKALQVECVDSNCHTLGTYKADCPIVQRLRQVRPDHSDLDPALCLLSHFVRIMKTPQICVVQLPPPRKLLRIGHPINPATSKNNLNNPPNRVHSNAPSFVVTSGRHREHFEHLAQSDLSGRRSSQISHAAFSVPAQINPRTAIKSVFSLEDRIG